MWGSGSRQSRQAGTTLVDLAVALAIFGVILIGVFLIWNYSQMAYFQGSEAADLQQNARAAMEQMAREIRQAGYDPCQYLTTCTSAFDPVQAGVFPVQAFSASGIWVRADRNANGSVTSGDPDESVCFYRDGGGVLRRKTTGGDCTTGGDELAGNITDLTLTYHKADGSTATDWRDIRLVRIAIEAQDMFLGTPLTVTLGSDVRLRDR